MVTPEDRASVDSILARARQDASKPVSQPANDGLGFAMPSPEELAALAQIAGQIGALGKNPGKERYKQLDPQTDRLAQMVGLDIITGSQQIGVSPAVVAGHISYYLHGHGVELSPDQVLAAAPAPAGGALSSSSLIKYAPFVLLGIGAVMMMQRR